LLTKVWHKPSAVSDHNSHLHSVTSEKDLSKIRTDLLSCLSFVFSQNKEEEKIVLTGSGPTVTKTITCAEIIKRKSKVSHGTEM